MSEAITVKHNEELRKWLEGYRESNGLTNAAIAKKLGLNAGATRVSKYISARPEGRVDAFEALVADMRRRVEGETFNFAADLIDTNVIREIATTARLVQASGGVGLVVGPAGIGKTIGSRAFAIENPTSLLATLNRSENNDKGLQAAVFRLVDPAGYKSNQSRWSFLVDRLKGSGRLLMMDNAHRMSRSAREWWFDFIDETGLPGLLLGNPEVLDAIRVNDQHFSRLSVKREVKLTQKGVRKVAAAVVENYYANASEELLDMAETVAAEPGQLRALVYQLKLAKKMQEMAPEGKKLSPVQAFRMAHANLVRDYEI